MSRPLAIALVELVVVVIAALLFVVFCVSDGGQDDPSRVTQMRLQRVGQTVTAIGTVLSGDSGLQSVVFDWGDGESDVTEFEESGGVWSVHAQHRYADEGDSRVRLTAVLGNGLAITDSRPISVLDDAPRPPEASIPPPRATREASTPTPTPSVTATPPPTPTPTATATAAPTKVATPAAPTPTATPTATATAAPTPRPVPTGPNQPPTVAIVSLRQSGPLTLTVVMTASDPEGQLVALAIEWGDATSDEVAGSNESLVGSHTYAAPGTYVVTVVALDAQGVEARVSQAATAQ